MINDPDDRVCPVFVDCIAERIKRDDKIALDSALLLWDKYHWPLKVLAVLGKMLTRYRNVKHG